MNGKQDPNRPLPARCGEHAEEVARETAALHALGALPADEAEAFERHLASGCVFCLAESTAFQETLAEVGKAVGAGSCPPSPSLRARLLERIATGHQAGAKHSDVQVWKRWKEQPPSRSGLSIVRSHEGDWEELAVRGVFVKQLDVDRERRTVTMLVRMEPGTDYPRHRHGGREECFVLEGELSVGGEILRAGDYQKADSGSTHDVQSTEKGCLLLITSSEDDELL